MVRRHLLDDAPWDTIERFQQFCDDRGVSMLSATLAWLLAQPGLTSVIAGATKPEQIEQNAEAASSWRPTDEDVAYISALFA
jgi:aryl-alcohol dehydrogenase-like predicted oxidoreductase